MKLRRKTWNPQTLTEMLQLYRDGVSVKNLAEKFERTQSSIRQTTSYYKIFRSSEHLSWVRRSSSGLPGVCDD